MSGERDAERALCDLLRRHREDLEGSGLTAETIRASGCISVDGDFTREFLGWGTSGLAFPYPRTEGESGLQLFRVKQDPRPMPAGKRMPKYVGPKKEVYPEGNRLYVPPNVDLAKLQDPTAPLIITEGEKKTLKANQEGFLTVGLAGVYSWLSKDHNGTSRPIDDLDAIPWSRRVVYVVFDSDSADNPSVMQAASRLRYELIGRGAVAVLAMPPPPSPEESEGLGLDGKFGLDDFLVARGPGALTALLARAEAESRVPVILSGLQEREVSAAAADALVRRNDPPTLFVHGGAITRVVEGPAPKLCLLRTVALQGRLSEDIDWLSESKKDVVSARQPRYIAPRMIEAPDPRLPVLRRLATAPVYDGTGSLRSTNGFHPGGGLFLALPDALSGAWPDDSVAVADVEDALGLLFDDWLGDFSFATSADRANHLAALLVPLVRDLIDGQVPFHAYTAPTRGVGKSKLPLNLSLVHFGRAEMTDLPNRDEETEKRITTFLMEGHPVVLFDNVDSGINSPALARLATAPFWTGRILGESKTVTAENRTLWLISGQNPAATDEIARRTVQICLVPTCERPWDRPPEQFRHPELETWSRSNRKRLLAALITLVQWWKKQGRPSGSANLGSFESYSRVVGGILAAARVEGFLGNREVGADRLIEEVEVRILRAWERACPSQTMTSSELLSFARNQGEEDVGIPKDYNAIKLGRALGKHVDRVFGGHRFGKGKLTRDGRIAWMFAAVPSPAPEPEARPTTEPEPARKAGSGSPSPQPSVGPAKAACQEPPHSGAAAPHRGEWFASSGGHSSSSPVAGGAGGGVEYPLRHPMQRKRCYDIGCPNLQGVQGVGGGHRRKQRRGGETGINNTLYGDRPGDQPPAPPAHCREASPARVIGMQGVVQGVVQGVDSRSPAPTVTAPTTATASPRASAPASPAGPPRPLPAAASGVAEPSRGREPRPVQQRRAPTDDDDDRARAARAAVSAVECEALALGWTHAALWGGQESAGFSTRGPGLVSSINPGTTIVEVTRQRIGLRAACGTETGFYNRDVAQPWISRGRAASEKT